MKLIISLFALIFFSGCETDSRMYDLHRDWHEKNGFGVFCSRCEHLEAYDRRIALQKSGHKHVTVHKL